MSGMAEISHSVLEPAVLPQFHIHTHFLFLLEDYVSHLNNYG